jgi:predicted metal-dependent HD superfamily phosphohydrolase
VVAAAGEDLLRRYAEPARAYHTLVHLADVLARLDVLATDPRVALPARERAVVSLAAFFHDAIYDAIPDNGAGSNEAASARLAREVLLLLGAPRPVTAEVARLVDLTAAHDPAPDDRLGALLCDADLGVLAAAPAAYEAYAAAVRREYAAVPDELFRAGRARILTALIERPAIFRTPPGHESWEAPARANVTAEVARLLAGDAAPPP